VRLGSVVGAGRGGWLLRSVGWDRGNWADGCCENVSLGSDVRASWAVGHGRLARCDGDLSDGIDGGSGVYLLAGASRVDWVLRAGGGDWVLGLAGLNWV